MIEKTLTDVVNLLGECQHYERWTDYELAMMKLKIEQKRMDILTRLYELREEALDLYGDSYRLRNMCNE